MKEGNDWVNSRNLSSLRLLGTVGETIKEPEWNWYYNVVGNKMSNCRYLVANRDWWNINFTTAWSYSDKTWFSNLTVFWSCASTNDRRGKEIEGNNVSGLLALKHLGQDKCEQFMEIINAL